MSDIKESDWKRFKEIHDTANQRFAEKCLAQVQYHLTDKSISPIERFFAIRDAMQERNKERARLFDDFRRSTAVMQIAFMRAQKLITDEELALFSEELRATVNNMLRMQG